MEPPIGDAVLVVDVLHEGNPVSGLRRLIGFSLAAKTKYDESQYCLPQFAEA
jgi:hypothetical protein